MCMKENPYGWAYVITVIVIAAILAFLIGFLINKVKNYRLKRKQNKNQTTTFSEVTDDFLEMILVSDLTN